MAEPKILVIIPTYNRPAMCGRAIESLRRQDFQDWLLVVAKNGGAKHLTDYVNALGDQLAQPRTRLLVLPEKGLGYALNEAVRHFGTPPFFAVLEDDDEWAPEFLSTMYRYITETGADAVHCMQIQEPDNKQSNGAPMDKARIRMVNWINFPMCLFRVDMFHKVDGFCNDAGPATDWDWHLRNLAAGARYEFLNQVLVRHHWHGSNYCVQVDGRPFVMERMQQGFYG